MSRHLLKYNLVSDFEADGDVVTSINPGVAYVQENKDVCYNNSATPEPNEPEVEPTD